MESVRADELVPRTPGQLGAGGLVVRDGALHAHAVLALSR
jgi:hypothetical protein